MSARLIANQNPMVARPFLGTRYAVRSGETKDKLFYTSAHRFGVYDSPYTAAIHRYSHRPIVWTWVYDYVKINR